MYKILARLIFSLVLLPNIVFAGPSVSSDQLQGTWEMQKWTTLTAEFPAKPSSRLNLEFIGASVGEVIMRMYANGEIRSETKYAYIIEKGILYIKPDGLPRREWGIVKIGNNELVYKDMNMTHYFERF